MPTRTWHAGDVLVWLVPLLPLLAVMPFGSLVAREAVTASPLYLYTVGLLLLVAAWIGMSDGWLGLFTGWATLPLLWSPSLTAFESVEILTFSALALCVLRTVPADRVEVIRLVLLGVGVAEVADGVQQALGYDVLWRGWQPLSEPLSAVFGTLGNSNYYGVYLALLLPLAPWWLLPVFGLGILLSHCFVAVVAAGCGLCWRWRARPMAVLALAGLALAAFLGVMSLKGPGAFGGWSHRLAVWTLALSQLSPLGAVIGAGPGSWIIDIPAAQQAAGIWPSSVFRQAHNEYLQVWYEGGLVALGLLSGWLWRHRAAFTGPYGGSLVACAVASLGMFPFRLAITGCTALVLMGLATRQEES